MTSRMPRPVAAGRPNVPRRRFLEAAAVTAGLSVGPLSLGNLLRAEQAAGIRNSRKAVIHVHLDGGPPHQDMIDLKPQAPVEIRGEFSGIATRLPGYSICELLPELANIADRIAFIRSVVGAVNVHNAFQCQSGFVEKDLASLGGRPAMGSVVAKLQGSTSDVAPSFVDLMQGRPLVRNSARPGFLGPAYQPFRPDISTMFARPLEPGMELELARRGGDHTTQLALLPELTTQRLNDRTSLLTQLDRLQRDMDHTRTWDAMDAFTQQAVGLLTSGEFARAIDLEREPPASLARYTLDDPALAAPHGTDEGATATKKFLLARRLVEAGVRYVSLSLSDFDTHSKNFPRMRRILPILDHGLATLVQDLEERGMLDDVAIVVWGEFGRTPKIDSKTGGRHHWPNVGMALLIGGGLQGGQVIGETDRFAGEAVSRPVAMQDVLATLYHTLGIDANNTTLNDPSGRPQFLLEGASVIRELV